MRTVAIGLLLLAAQGSATMVQLECVGSEGSSACWGKCCPLGYSRVGTTMECRKAGGDSCFICGASPACDQDALGVPAAQVIGGTFPTRATHVYEGMSGYTDMPLSEFTGWNPLLLGMRATVPPIHTPGGYKVAFACPAGHQACDAMLFLYSCPPCESVDGGLGAELVAAGWDLVRCGPRFQCDAKAYGGGAGAPHKLVVYHKEVAGGDTVEVEVTKAVTYSFWAMAAKTVSCEGLQQYDCTATAGCRFDGKEDVCKAQRCPRVKWSGPALPQCQKCATDDCPVTTPSPAPATPAPYTAAPETEAPPPSCDCKGYGQCNSVGVCICDDGRGGDDCTGQEVRCQAWGDPHVTNVKGQVFDFHEPGPHVYYEQGATRVILQHWNCGGDATTPLSCIDQVRVVSGGVRIELNRFEVQQAGQEHGKLHVKLADGTETVVDAFMLRSLPYVRGGVRLTKVSRIDDLKAEYTFELVGGGAGAGTAVVSFRLDNTWNVDMRHHGSLAGTSGVCFEDCNTNVYSLFKNMDCTKSIGTKHACKNDDACEFTDLVRTPVSNTVATCQNSQTAKAWAEGCCESLENCAGEAQYNACLEENCVMQWKGDVTASVCSGVFHPMMVAQGKCKGVNAPSKATCGSKSHPIFGCDRCWTNLAQASSANCNPCPDIDSAKPHFACNQCWADANEAARNGCGTPSTKCTSASHPYSACGGCFADAAQAKSSGCNIGGSDVTCSGTHPFKACDACYEDEAQARSSGCSV